jgi:ABC-2 type transport system ATP-binding protein
VRALLEELRGRGVSVLLNSHLLSEVELVCDRVVIITRGGSSPKAGRTSSPTQWRRGRDGRGRPRYDIGRDEVPDLVARLVADGERIYGVHVVRSTLEEAYLEAVEGAE